MRALTKNQKAIIKEWVKESKFDRKILINPIERMPYELYEKLVEMNDFETINWEIQRYVEELFENSPHNPWRRWD